MFSSDVGGALSCSSLCRWRSGDVTEERSITCPPAPSQHDGNRQILPLSQGLTTPLYSALFDMNSGSYGNEQNICRRGDGGNSVEQGSTWRVG